MSNEIKPESRRASEELISLSANFLESTRLRLGQCVRNIVQFHVTQVKSFQEIGIYLTANV